MKKHDVIKGLENFYAPELDKFSLEKLARVYQSNREKYPSLDLDRIFEILQQPAGRLPGASLEKSLQTQLRLVYTALQTQKTQFENLGKSCPGYISRFMKITETLLGYSSVDESPTVSTRIPTV